MREKSEKTFIFLATGRHFAGDSPFHGSGDTISVP